MLYERDSVLKDLRKYVIEFFIYKDKEKKQIVSFRGTLREDLLPKNYQEEKLMEQTFHEENKTSISSLNVVTGKWVVIDISDIKYIQVIDGYN